jgi:hypothetical protein
MVTIIFFNIDLQSFLLGITLGILVGIYVDDTVRWLRAVLRRTVIHHRWGKSVGP